MKKMLITIVSGLICSAVYGQNIKHESVTQDPVVSERYCVELKDGKMTLMQDSKPVTMEITLNDGSKVTPAAMVIRKDGTVLALKTGDCIDKEGNINNMVAPQAPIKK
jgi:hypothetical protein